MLALWQHEPLSVRELGRLLQLDPGTLSPLLKRLEASGLVHRERSQQDERVLAVTLTRAGRRLRKRAEKIPPAVVDMLGMEIAELKSLHTTLTAVIDVAQQALERDGKSALIRS
jgi:MarR family transcriptional regulator, organic hydroperoxide resistance regulator